MNFRQLKLWRALKRSPGSHNRNLREDLGWTEYSIARGLMALERKGCATCIGCSWARRWYATDIAPKDGRGQTAASLAAIKPYQHFAVARLARANYARGVKARPVPKPKPATELERCWPVAAVLVPIRQDVGDAG